MNKFGSNNPFYGKKHSLESRLKMSVSRSSNKNHLFGKKHSVETIEKMRQKRLAKWQDPNFRKYMVKKLAEINQLPEIRAKISAANKGRPKSEKTKLLLSNIGKTLIGSKNPMYGRKHSEESKDKMRDKRIYVRIPNKDTVIEVKLQTFLSNLNIPYQKNINLIGRPDIFIEPNICIFADGCYWHGCQSCFENNHFNERQRKSIIWDQIVTQRLIEQNYIVLRFWEHDLLKMSLDEFTKKLREVIKHEQQLAI